MIIRKWDYSEEELERIRQTRIREGDAMRRIGQEAQKHLGDSGAKKEELAKALREALRAGERERAKIFFEAVKRYGKAYSKEEIAQHAKEIIGALEKADYQATKKQYAELPETYEKAFPEAWGLARESYEDCKNFILSVIEVQGWALKGHQAEQQQLIKMAEAKAAGWYSADLGFYYPHAVPVDILAHHTALPVKKTLDTLTYQGNGTKEATLLLAAEVVRQVNRKKSDQLGPGAHKLYITGLSQLLQRNKMSKGKGKNKISSLDVHISLADLAARMGYDITSRATNSPEAAAAEKKRIKQEIDRARKEVQKSLQKLESARVTFTTSEGKKVTLPLVGATVDATDCNDARGHAGIRAGYIEFNIGAEIAALLADQPLTFYHWAALAIDERHPNAYAIYERLMKQAANSNNQKAGTADRLGVDALLRYTDLPKIEDVRRDMRSWRERILKPFLQNLNYLKAQGILRSWHFTQKRSEGPIKQEALRAADYEEFAAMNLHYELQHPMPRPAPAIPGTDSEKPEAAPRPQKAPGSKEKKQVKK